jgi:ribonuclease P protein component
VKREGRLTKPEQFATVYKEGGTQADRLLVLKAKPNQLDFSRYGISVSKRVGSAVVRNRVKRVLREILRLTPIPPGWDFIFIARNPTAHSKYNEFKESATRLLARIQVKTK